MSLTERKAAVVRRHPTREKRLDPRFLKLQCDALRQRRVHEAAAAERNAPAVEPPGRIHDPSGDRFDERPMEELRAFDLRGFLLDEISEERGKIAHASLKRKAAGQRARRAAERLELHCRLSFVGLAPDPR